MADPYAPGSKEWWLVRQVANGDERRSWYELTDADRKALAAAPPPPDVSRGLDREEVARELREIAFEVSSMVCAASDVHKVYPDPAKAVDRIDALLAALSAPAGGGFGPGARAGWGMAAATEDPATEPTDQSTTRGEKP